MNLVGYFPGVDYRSKDQYGRRVHVQKLIESVDRDSRSDGTFIVGGDEFPSSVSCDMYFTDDGRIPLGPPFDEVRNTVLLARVITRADDDIDFIYTRDSPRFGAVICSLAYDIPLILEANGVPSEEGTDSFRGSVQKGVYEKIRQLNRRCSSLIVAVSESIRDELTRQVPNTDVYVSENGVDTDKFYPGEKETGRPPYRICYVGGLQEWQGIDRMLSVVGNLQSDVRMDVVGGEETQVSELREVAHDCGVEDIVEFHGRVAHDEVPEFIRESDVCFGPFTESRKASPLKIFEYLACGREVIYVNDHGLEYFEELPGTHHFGYDLDDATLAEHIDTVLSELATNTAAVEYVRENHSWEAVMEKILQACNERVTRNSQPH